MSTPAELYSIERRKRGNRGSKLFFGESFSGKRYEYEDIPAVDNFHGNSDDGSDEFENVGDLRVRLDNKKRSKVVKNYLLGEVLGEGANAKVKEGLDVNTLRILAVKIIEKRHVERIKDGMESVRREISIMKKMKKHNNVIELVEVIDDPNDSKIYVVMELANGCSLQEIIDSAPEQRIPVEQAKFYFQQLMRGLQHLHGKGVVHRDIKPANLMLTTEHELKISDFGVAEYIDKYNDSDKLTRTAGTPKFLAPEIASGHHDFFSGIAVDVWAAGITLYFLLVGTAPFDATTELQLYKKISEGTYEMPDFLDDDAQDLIQKMLTRDPSERISVRDILKHPWLQEVSLHSSRSRQKFIPIEMREIDLVKNLSTYDAVDADNEGTGKLQADSSVQSTGQPSEMANRSETLYDKGKYQRIVNTIVILTEYGFKAQHCFVQHAHFCPVLETMGREVLKEQTLLFGFCTTCWTHRSVREESVFGNRMKTRSNVQRSKDK